MYLHICNFFSLCVILTKCYCLQIVIKNMSANICLHLFIDKVLSICIRPLMNWLVCPLFMNLEKNLKIHMKILHNFRNETYKNDTEQINTILAETKIYRSILDHSFPVIYVIFMGPWSDHYGRKLSLIIPFVGYIVQSIAYLICAQFFIDSADPFTMNILTSLPRSVTGVRKWNRFFIGGERIIKIWQRLFFIIKIVSILRTSQGEPAYAMAAYAYISDITTHKSRTIRRLERIFFVIFSKIHVRKS